MKPDIPIHRDELQTEPNPRYMLERGAGRGVNRWRMFSRVTGAVVLAALLLAQAAQAGAGYVPATVAPPWVTREFRGVWVATIGNVDWPSKPGLPVEQQKKELLTILNCAAKLNLNAVILQVRPCCDALYDSKLEPWSYYLTGEMGRAPSPYYDPLRFAVEEAHKRGLELHAWFSPYRAGHPSEKPPIAANHVSRTHPALVRKYRDLMWLDPGEKEVQDYTVRVVMDVVDRYDIDGVHFDDRLGYPTEQDAQRRVLDFPDDATFKRYQSEGGNLERDDWRRENVNTFVRRIYEAVKASKPWVKVGIAPSGIWQTGNPPQIKGQSAYSALYTDSRKWLANGWLDYCSPQLYWEIAPPQTSFPVLLKWWLGQNPRGRNIWPGLDSEKVGRLWKADEIVNQIKADRNLRNGAGGVIHYSASCLVENSGRIANTLLNTVYSRPALVPASPWLEQSFPARPILKVESGRKAVWEPVGMTNGVSVWVFQVKSGEQWQTKIVSGDTRGMTFSGTPEAVAVTAIDRCGVASPAAVMKRENAPGR